MPSTIDCLSGGKLLIWSGGKFNTCTINSAWSDGIAINFCCVEGGKFGHLDWAGGGGAWPGAFMDSLMTSPSMNPISNNAWAAVVAKFGDI